MTTIVNRSDLNKAMPQADEKTILAFEELFATAPDAVKGLALQVAATKALSDATVVTLSPNDTLANERVLAFDYDVFNITDDGAGGNLNIGLLSSIAATYGFRLSLNLFSDTNLDLPSSGALLESTLGGGPYADDAAAATGGVVLGAPYRQTGGAVVWRQA